MENELKEATEFYRFLKVFGVTDGWEFGEDFYRELIYFIVKERSCVAAPRGSGKTSLFSRWWPLYNLLEVQSRGLRTRTGLRLDIEVMLVSESEKLTLQHVGWIRQQLVGNKRLREVYGNQVPKATDSHVFSSHRLELLNGSKVYGLGSSAQIRGYHPTHIVVDDLESTKNMDTPEKLQSLRDWFERSLLGCVTTDTRSVAVAGTIIARESLLMQLLANPIWHGRKFKALNQRECADGSVEEYSLLESRWPLEWLRKRRAELGEWAFASEYQNEPRPSTAPIIRLEWIKRYDGNIPASNGKIVQWYIGVDPAVTEERNGCDSAIAVFARTENHVMWEKVIWRGKVSGPNLIRRIMEMYYMVQKWACGTPVSLGVEEAAQQKFIRQAINEMDSSIMVQPLKPHADKVTRMLDISRHFENGRVVMKTDWAIDLLCAAPDCSMDVPDAITHTIKLCERDLPEFNIPGEACEIANDWNGVGDVEMEMYSGLAQDMGNAIIRMPLQLLNKRLEAQRLQQRLEEMGW